LIGDLNVRFQATYGDEAIRWGLVWLSSSFVFASIACALSARDIREDLAMTRAASGAERAPGDASTS
jgi:hypothetical protein